jgi:hypothetical protein
MRAVEPRLLLALILVLLGATVIVGLNLGDDDSQMALEREMQALQTQPLRTNSEEKTLASVRLPSSAPRPSRTDSEIALRSCASVIDLVCVLRC